ncbi:MAG: hypothetical protein KME16_12155 [Scytolyngbya sp. HA4215-MV1]|jgi:hypothetical protein|nr:hypothetical protein [Scytolyngbya sp. HA4215-MV1]
MSYSKFNPLSSKVLMSAGAMFVALAVLGELPGLPLTGNKSGDNRCQSTPKAEIALSRQQLAKLLTIPEGDQRIKVQAILGESYCKLPTLEVRAGTKAEREAYPLEFDRSTRLVVLYEGDQYAGYRFDVR